MKIALIGASGFTGSALLTEALSRGHQVTALVTRPERISAQPNLTAVACDALDSAVLAQKLAGHDVVISAFSGHAQPDVADYYLRGFESILNACRSAAAPRLLLVGGAASLLLPDGTELLDAPDFPAPYRASALGARAALQQLRSQRAVHWSFLSPAAELFPGERTGQFRLGQDHLLLDAKGRSRISTADFAVAMLNEAENPQHVDQRFCVAY